MKLNIKKLQSGGLFTTYKAKNSKYNNLSVPNKELEITNLNPPTQVNYTQQFKQSKNNFLNLPQTPNYLSIMGSGNIGYDSKQVLEILDKFEGFKDKVYKDGNGIDTIGHGLTAKKYIQKGTITRDESLQGVKEHIDNEVIPHLKNKPYWSKLNNNQKTALIDYVYNIGSGNFNVKSPSLQKALNENNWEEAAKQMDFGYSDIKNPGLKIRRDYERQLFLK